MSDIVQRFELPEIAKILRLGRNTVRRRIDDGLLDVQRDGKRVFVTKDALLRYLAALEANPPMMTSKGGRPFKVAPDDLAID